MASPQLAEGQHVRLSGLREDPSFNQREGVLKQWSANSQRWVVELDDKTKYKVKPENLHEASAAVTWTSDSYTGRPSGPREPEREPDVPQGRPETNPPRGLRLIITAAEQADGVTYFQIVISFPGAPGEPTHSIQRRYRDIRSLRDDLAASQSLADETSAPFPQKALLCKGQRLEQRRLRLEQWLQKQVPQVSSFNDLSHRWCTFLQTDGVRAVQ